MLSDGNAATAAAEDPEHGRDEAKNRSRAQDARLRAALGERRVARAGLHGHADAQGAT